MDLSEIYIKMCKSGVEIHEMWQPQVGDFVIGNHISSIIEWSDHLASLLPLFTTRGKWAWYQKKEMVWLPRQDQLQIIIGGFREQLGKFDGLLLPHIDAWCFQYNSMEQLWMTFVMDEKYHKCWNGKSWQECNDIVEG